MSEFPPYTLLASDVSIAERRALRVLWSGGCWTAQPDAPFKPSTLLIEGAPDGAWLHVRVTAELGHMIAASKAGLSASLFRQECCEANSKRLDWPVLLRSTMLQIELKDAADQIICEGVEITVFGEYLRHHETRVY